MTARKQPDMTITTIRIPTEDANRLREVAQNDDRSVSSVVRLALRDYLRQKGDA
jgi:predicted transcriptional regulator